MTLYFFSSFYSYLSSENYVEDLTHLKKKCENSRKNKVEKNLLVVLWQSMRSKNNNKNIYNCIILACYNQAT